MNRCATPLCLRAAIKDGARCEMHTSEMQTQAFAPEWIKRMRTGKQIPKGIGW